MPRQSPRKGASVLIAAVSTRSLAAAAKRAGLVALTVDFFADRDTQELAFASRKLAGSMKAGIDQDALLSHLDALAALAPSPILGLLYGSGFEAHPDLLQAVAARWPVLGNSAETVAAVKDPVRFFSEAEKASIPFPETQTTRPDDPAGWLAKRIGGAGGSHVGDAGATTLTEVYYQRRVAGRPVSMLFIGDGAQMRPLGFSEQWSAAGRTSPWRYGGAVRPADLSGDAQDRMCGWISQLVRAFGLKGLGSADFLISGDEIKLLEINPRPGATLDIFDDPAHPLISFHLDAVTMRKLPTLDSLADAAASAVVFAPRTVTIPQGLDWPAWASDIPKPGERIDGDGPVCTVMARGKTKEHARQCAEARVRDILAAISGTIGRD